MRGADELHRMIDVIDDLLPRHARQLRRRDVFLLRLVPLVRQEADRVVDHDDAALAAERTDHVVGHIARMAGDRAHGRVRRDERRLACLDRIPERLVGDVGDVDHHAQAVQLADDVLAEVCQAVVRRLVARRIAPVGVHAVRQRQIPHAETLVLAQDGKAVVDHVTAFHPHQRRDPAGLVRRPHFRGRRRQRDLVRVLLGEPPDVIDEDQRALHRFGAGDGAGHVDREERGVEPALAHAWEIDMVLAGFRLVPDHEVPAVPAEHHGRVDVRVDDDRLLVDASRAGLRRFSRGFLRRRLRAQQRCREHDKRKSLSHPALPASSTLG